MPAAEVIHHHLGHDAAGRVARAEKEDVIGCCAHWQHALSEATASGNGIQHAPALSWLSDTVSGIQHALCIAEVRVSSPYTGTLSRVWKVSQATPCGSVTQYLSESA